MFSVGGTDKLLERAQAAGVHELLARDLVEVQLGKRGVALMLPREVVVDLLANGYIDPSLLPVEIVNVGRFTIIINTRSAATLMQAGIRSSEVVWRGPSLPTAYDDMVRRMMDNRIYPAGIGAVRMSGTQVWVEIPTEWQVTPRPRLSPK
jgi:hypothetical protein